MRLQPKTEREIAEENLLAAGEYDFEVLSAEEKPSAKGNDMIVLSLAIYAPDGSKRGVKDYLLEAFAFKLRHFCAACGLMARYDAGQLTADDCVGRQGRCKVAIEENKTGDYPPKNAVKDYIVPKAGGGSPAPIERAEPAQAADTASGDAADAEINPDSLPF